MSGGIAYVLDEDGGFRGRCNSELVDFEELGDADADELRALVEEHAARTRSTAAARLLADWASALARFVKVLPHDYKRALADEVVRHDDAPVSTGGAGFLTIEDEREGAAA
jgi:glutamate synthase domain-containing protein 3